MAYVTGLRMYGLVLLPTLYLDGDVVLAEVLHFDELVDAVDGQVPLHVPAQTPSGGHAHRVGAHHLCDTTVRGRKGLYSINILWHRVKLQKMRKNCHHDVSNKTSGHIFSLYSRKLSTKGSCIIGY